MTTTLQRRVPRPMGTTEIAYNHSKNKSQETKQLLEGHLIRHYLNSNYLYCQRHYSIPELSTLLNIRTPIIMGYIIQQGDTIRENMDKLTNGDSLRALLSIGIQSTLEDRSRALQQYSILCASQGEVYRPFISGEVNKALKLVMESGQNITNITKSLGGGNTFNTLIQNASMGPNEVEQDYVTVDKAVMLIKDSGATPLAFNDAQQERIYEEHGIEGMPEVHALKQVGVDTSKEALNLKSITELGTHEDRRAIDEGHDLDSDEVH